MSGKKIITIFGATGGQGGAVAQTFLNDPKLKGEWSVRGVTRDATKDSSKKLAEQGAQVVAADMNEKESLVKAMEGAYAVFAVTNYWEKMDQDLEIQQGKNLADAAKETGVQHYIWSSLYNVNKLSKGALKHVYHFDSKALVEDYAREIGIPATFFMPGFYMTNLPGGMFRPSSPDNAWTFSLPIASTAPIPMFFTGDTGKYVKAALLHREETLGKRLLGATAYMTGQEVVDGFSDVFPEAGQTARYYELSKDQFQGHMTSTGSPDFVAEELYENMRLMQDFGYYGCDSLEWTHGLIEDKLTTWEGFSKQAKGFAELK